MELNRKEQPTYFLCGRWDIPKLVKKAEEEAAQILKEFAMFYKTAGELAIQIYPIEYPMGFSIGGRLTWDGDILLEESDCGLLFLHLNEVMFKRMIQLGFPFRGKETLEGEDTNVPTKESEDTE